jgi:hypothetical protein
MRVCVYALSVCGITAPLRMTAPAVAGRPRSNKLRTGGGRRRLWSFEGKQPPSRTLYVLRKLVWIGDGHSPLRDLPCVPDKALVGCMLHVACYMVQLLYVALHVVCYIASPLPAAPSNRLRGWKPRPACQCRRSDIACISPMTLWRWIRSNSHPRLV